MQEKWIKWEPISGLGKKYYIESITERVEDKFNMILFDSDTKKKVLISFPHGIDAYRSTDESFTLAIINYLGKTYGIEFYGDWTFFEVKNSEYLKWLSEKSYGISEDYGLRHFCILGVDSVIDMACTYEPTVTFID